MPDMYLTFRINSSSKGGTLTITGRFDLEFGFTLEQDRNGSNRFAAEGARLYKPKPDQGEVVFCVSSKGRVSMERYNLRFEDDNDTQYNVHVEGTVQLSVLEVADQIRSL